MKTYTTMRSGTRNFVSDAWRLYRVRTNALEETVSSAVDQAAAVARAFQTATGCALKDRAVLVIGAGQTSREAIAFGIDNQVTAIDLDVVPHGWSPRPYVELLRQNGPTRTAKTVGRKILGVDRKFERAMCRALDVDRPKPANYLQMDAAAMTFANASFDVVYSFSVFEHLTAPSAVLNEAIRVLRPGGLAAISLHLYSSEGGCHDLRIFNGDRKNIPYWAQLRPAQKHTVIESCYMNEWRLDQWRSLFETMCPGATTVLEPHRRPYAEKLDLELAAIRQNNELLDYTDEELRTVNYGIVWQKPYV